jgi:UV DNA damage endonuclease
MTEYKFEDLPDWEEIQEILAEAGRIANQGSQRLEFHPTHFTILASNNPTTVERSIRDLEQHSRIFDTMGFEPSHWNPLNIHVGGAFGDKRAATQRWASNFKRLSSNCRSRVVVENDDKPNMYSVKDLHEMIYQEVGVPITFDIFHHGFCTGGLSEDQAAQMASSTWKDAPMVIHWSSSMKIHENSQVKDVAHADYIYDAFQDWGTGGYLMCESKAKELSVLEYWKKGPRS